MMPGIRRQQMPINHIVAIAESRVIGSRPAIPWRVKGEQKLFKHIIDGHVGVMGEKRTNALGDLVPIDRRLSFLKSFRPFLDIVSRKTSNLHYKRG
jgi:hypothetical protein